MLVTAMTIMELSIAIVSIIGAFAACLHGSKCTSCKIGLSGCELHRAVNNPSDAAESSPSSSSQVPPLTDADYTEQVPSHDRR